jgi:drug/metabolite transporter (DMT)-like permease
VRSNPVAILGFGVIGVCMYTQSSPAALGAAVVIGLVAVFTRRLPQLPNPLAEHPRGRLRWQATLIVGWLVVEQAWGWAGSPGMPNEPLWLISGWIDPDAPQIRILPGRRLA